MASDVIEDRSTASNGAAETRWEKLHSERQTQLSKKRALAELTLPYLLPPEGRSAGDNLADRYSSDGARGCRTLASKLVLAMFPSQQAFFDLVFDEAALSVVEEDAKQMAPDRDIRSEIAEKLRPNVATIMQEFETANIRGALIRHVLYLIVTGDGLGIWESLESPMRIIRTDSFVVRRNGRGEVIELIIRETIGLDSLPKEIQGVVAAEAGDTADKDDLPLFTWVRKQGDGGYTTNQECSKVEFNFGSFDAWAKSPFVGPLRWLTIDGENYGIGHAEDNEGSLRTVEGMSQLITQGSAALAKINWLVDKSAGQNLAKRLTESENGAVLAATLGGGEPIIPVTAGNKAVDFQVVQAHLGAERAALRAAFLQTESIQRDAERVTAEEIRMLAQELENALGGVYTMLSEEFQTAVLSRLIHLIKQQKPDALPQIDVDGVETSLLTGLPALGAGHQVNAMHQFITAATQIPGAEPWINVQAILKVFQKHLGVEANVVNSEAAVSQQAQQDQQASLMQGVAPGVAREVAKSAASGAPPQEA